MTAANDVKKQNRIIELEAEQVFGSHSKAREWLNTKNLVLGSTPLELLETDDGATEVRKMLSAIGHGGVV